MTPSGTPRLSSVGNAPSGSPERVARSWISSRKSGWPGGGWALGGEPRVVRMVSRSSSGNGCCFSPHCVDHMVYTV